MSFCLLRVRVRVRGVCTYGKAFCFTSGKEAGVRENCFIISPLFPFLPARCFPLSYPPTPGKTTSSGFSFLRRGTSQREGFFLKHPQHHQITYFDIVHILGKEKRGKQLNLFLYPHDTLGNVTASKLNKLLFFCSNVPFLIS